MTWHELKTLLTNGRIAAKRHSEVATDYRNGIPLSNPVPAPLKPMNPMPEPDPKPEHPEHPNAPEPDDDETDEELEEIIFKDPATIKFGRNCEDEEIISRLEKFVHQNNCEISVDGDEITCEKEHEEAIRKLCQ